MDSLLDAPAFEPPTFPSTDEEREELIDILEWSKGVFRLAHPAWPSVN